MVNTSADATAAGERGEEGPMSPIKNGAARLRRAPAELSAV